MAGGGQLRRAGVEVHPGRKGTLHGNRGGHWDLQLLPAPPHDDGGGRGRVHGRRSAGQGGSLPAGLGAGLRLPPGQGQLLRAPVRPAVRGAARRVRPQVRVLPLRLQPEGDGHAGGCGVRAAGEVPVLRGEEAAQLPPAEEGAGGRGGLLYPAGGVSGLGSVLVRVPAHVPGGRGPEPGRAEHRKLRGADEDALRREPDEAPVLRRDAGIRGGLPRCRWAGEHRPDHARLLLGGRVPGDDGRDGGLHGGGHPGGGPWIGPSSRARGASSATP